MQDILTALRSDAAIAELVPYLAAYAQSTCGRTASTSGAEGEGDAMLLRHMQVAQAWISNRHLRGCLAPYLPALLRTFSEIALDGGSAQARHAASAILKDLARADPAARAKLQAVFAARGVVPNPFAGGESTTG